jgi:hypothetical protein
MSTANPFRRPSNRQFPLIAEAFIDFQDLLRGAPVVTAATAKAGVSEAGDVNSAGIAASTGSSLSGIQFNLFELPAGAIVIGGDVKILTAFNSVTSDTLIIGFDATGNQYINALDMKTAARTAWTIPNRRLSTTEEVLARWTGVGTAPSAGLMHITMQYIIPGRAVENQGV